MAEGSCGSRIEEIIGPYRRAVGTTAFVLAPLVLLISNYWPALARYNRELYGLYLILFFVALLTWIDWSKKPWHKTNLVAVIMLAVFTTIIVGFSVYRSGRIVARAMFDPGIAPFDITVREVPVLVTGSNHFIITLSRGQYPVTSFRYFWINYTPKKVRIEWKRMENFAVIFDDRYIARCDWQWGSTATWRMEVPPDGQVPGDQP